MVVPCGLETAFHCEQPVPSALKSVTRSPGQQQRSVPKVHRLQESGIGEGSDFRSGEGSEFR